MTIDDVGVEVSISKKEIAARLLEMSYLTGQVAPVYSREHRNLCKAALGQDLTVVLPTLLSDVGRLAAKDPPAALPYVLFVRDAANYVLGLGPYPTIQGETSDETRRRVRKMIKSMHLEEVRPLA